MFNRKEIEYNIRALIETWIFGKKLSPNTFSLEFRNGGKSEKEITSIGKDGVIGEMVDALTEKVKYERIILFAKVDGKKENIGELEII